MPQLLTQRDIRPAGQLPFCYLCGLAIDSREERHPDHIPPKAVFAESDRDFPLKVAAHGACNNRHSLTDEVISQLIAVIHGKRAAERDRRLLGQTFNVDGFKTPFLGFTDTNLIGQIFRWVRGFHAALYREFLQDKTRWEIHPSFPHGEIQEDGFTINKILDQQYQFVEVIKKNRVAQCLDRIVCNNGKMQYECIWYRMDSGDNAKWACVFALQVYDWSKLADSTPFSKRGCVGLYQPVAGRPEQGTIGTELDFKISNVESLDAFGV